MEQSQDLRQLFVRDGQTQILALEQFFSGMADSAQAGFEKATLETALRNIHSLKSELSFLGYHEIEERAHQLSLELSSAGEGESVEAAIRGIRNDDTWLLFKRGVESLLRSLRLEMSPAEHGQQDLFGELSAGQARILAEAKLRGEKLYVAECSIHRDEPMPGPRMAFLAAALEQQTNLIRSEPEAAQLAEHEGRQFAALFTSDLGIDAIKALFAKDLVENLSIRLHDPENSFAAKGTADNSRKPAAAEEGKYPVAESWVRELLWYRLMIKDQDWGSRVLAHAVQKAFSVPVAQLLERFQGYLSRFARELGKEAKVTFQYEPNLLIPRDLVDSVHTILLHLVRNAVDHGIEAPDQRKAQGKDAQGHLTARILRQKDRWHLSIRDDGAGVDLEALAKRLGRDGLELDNSGDLIAILAQPGMSTRELPGRTSGMGMGLTSVAMQVIGQLGGTVRLESERGKGTRISCEFSEKDIMIPCFAFRVGEQRAEFPRLMVKVAGTGGEGLPLVRGLLQRSKGPVYPVVLRLLGQDMRYECDAQEGECVATIAQLTDGELGAILRSLPT